MLCSCSTMGFSWSFQTISCLWARTVALTKTSAAASANKDSYAFFIILQVTTCADIQRAHVEFLSFLELTRKFQDEPTEHITSPCSGVLAGFDTCRASKVPVVARNGHGVCPATTRIAIVRHGVIPTRSSATHSKHTGRVAPLRARYGVALESLLSSSRTVTVVDGDRCMDACGTHRNMDRGFRESLHRPNNCNDRYPT